MSLNRRAAKRDQNEGDIVRALEQVGAKCVRLSIENVPDLLVGFRGQTYLLEVKSAKNDLTPGQADWIMAWPGGPARPVWTIKDALEAIGAIRILKGDAA